VQLNHMQLDLDQMGSGQLTLFLYQI